MRQAANVASRVTFAAVAATIAATSDSTATAYATDSTIVTASVTTTALVLCNLHKQFYLCKLFSPELSTQALQHTPWF